MAALRSSGRASATSAERDVVVVEPVPLPVEPDPDFNPLHCLSSATVVEQCRYRANPNPTPIEHLYRQLARQDPNVRTLDLDKLVCPLFPTCDAVIRGVIVKWDKSHVTNTFALTLAPAVDTHLKSMGVIPLTKAPK